jgi:hypothetical protein
MYKINQKHLYFILQRNLHSKVYKLEINGVEKTWMEIFGRFPSILKLTRKKKVHHL